MATSDVAADAATAALTSEQIHALFDILTHRETYAEIESFKYPDAVTDYGVPFATTTQVPPTHLTEGGWRSWAPSPMGSGSNTPRDRSRSRTRAASEDGGRKDTNKGDEDVASKPSQSPILQTLLTRFLLRLPWLRDLPGEFWSVRMQGLLSKLAEADLSESYDKGTLGLRKTLATGSSTVLEMLGRGALGGVKKKPDSDQQVPGEKKEYDMSKAEDLERAWDDAVQRVVYGDLIAEMFAHMTTSDNLEATAPEAEAGALYSIIHLATLLHHIFVISPEGQYLLKLLENIHGLLPYKLIKQTLRVGNAATMISGMVRLLLTKLSVGGLTNWFGLTQNADDGMNLLQRIISLVLSWDAGEFRKSAEKIERLDKDERPDEASLQALAKHASEASRDEHEAARETSTKQSQSIVAAVLGTKGENPEAAFALSESQHANGLAFYSAQLSAHDRDAITNVLCKSQPDLLTHLIKELVNAYDPMIRAVHAGVDLRQFLEEGQTFIDEFIRAGQPKRVEAENSDGDGEDGEARTRPASVEDYVDLLVRNKGCLYRFMHAVASSCPDVWGEVEKWAVKIVTNFRTETDEGKKKSMDDRLVGLFDTVPEASRPAALKALDAHAVYLASVEKTSRGRLQHILNAMAKTDNADESASNGSSSQIGPGMYLMRWQGLLDEATITPSLPVGPIRSGKDVKHALAMGKTVIGGGEDAPPAAVVGDDDTARKNMALAEADVPEAPDTGVVAKELGAGFLEILQEVGGPRP